MKSSDPSLAEDLRSVVETSIRQLTELTSEDFDKKLNSFNIENEKFSSRFELQEVNFSLESICCFIKMKNIQQSFIALEKLVKTFLNCIMLVTFL